MTDPRIERFRKSADLLTKHIQEKSRPMSQAFTPKRGKQYKSRVHDAGNLERTQEALRVLADTLEKHGRLPFLLTHLTKREEVAPLVHKSLLTDGGYYECRTDTEFRDQSETAKALRTLIEEARSPDKVKLMEERARQERINVLVDRTRACRIDGYFPTPPAVVLRLLTYADVRPGMSVLEPSAGKGDIADAARKCCLADVSCVEIHQMLREILEAKQHKIVGQDFLQLPYPEKKFDRVLMNPPFEDYMDAAHVMHAYGFVKPGGRIVAIVGEGSFSASRATATNFRAWLQTVDARCFPIEPGAFDTKDAFRKTGISCRFVVIDCPNYWSPKP